MSLQRKLIRNAVAKLLKGRTQAQDRVFASRAHPIGGEALPLILVYTRTDAAERYVEAPKEYLRTVKLAVEIVAEAPQTGCLDDLLDDIAREVEILMMRDDSLGGLCREVELDDTEIDIESDGEKPIGAARITFDVEYTDQLPLAEDAGRLRDLKTAGVKYDLDPKDGVIEAENRIDLE